MNKIKLFFFLIIISFSYSQQIANTKDGKAVVLYEDGTWPIMVHWVPIPQRHPTTNFKEYELKFVSKARRA